MNACGRTCESGSRAGGVNPLLPGCSRMLKTLLLWLI